MAAKDALEMTMLTVILVLTDTTITLVCALSVSQIALNAPTGQAVLNASLTGLSQQPLELVSKRVPITVDPNSRRQVLSYVLTVIHTAKPAADLS